MNKELPDTALSCEWVPRLDKTFQNTVWYCRFCGSRPPSPEPGMPCWVRIKAHGDKRYAEGVASVGRVEAEPTAKLEVGHSILFSLGPYTLLLRNKT